MDSLAVVIAVNIFLALLIFVFRNNEYVQVILIALMGVVLYNLQRIDDIQGIPSDLLINYISIPFLVLVTSSVLFICRLVLNKAKEASKLKQIARIKIRK